MGKLLKNIYEHLKTKKKYNTLQIKYETKCEDYEKLIIKLNEEKKSRQLQKQAYDERIKFYINENTKLQEEIAKLQVQDKIEKDFKEVTQKYENKAKKKADK